MKKHILLLIACVCCFLDLDAQSSSQGGRGNPEPADWYAGDLHVHRSCDGSTPIPPGDLPSMMQVNDLAVISVLGDMGNNYSADRLEDLGNVNGKDSPLSAPGRIIHYGAEWHWDATQWEAPHQALGGHLVLLGLKTAEKMWEPPYKVLDWAGEQKAIRGFAHMQYLHNTIEDKLNCCIPIDYPVEAAFDNIEFLAEEQEGGSENAVLGYYKLLNCGFRIAFAGETDYPCNKVALGSVLTYVHIPGKELTYANWLQGIAEGRTVVSRNAHNEFLDLKVNKKEGPGDEIKLRGKRDVLITATWSVKEETSGRLQLVNNGKVIAEVNGKAKPGVPLIVSAKHNVNESSWIAARRMDEQGQRHMLHTSPVYITLKNRPVRARREDAEFFVSWIDHIVKQIEPGGPWNKYFPTDLQAAKERYTKAREIYARIAAESDH